MQFDDTVPYCFCTNPPTGVTSSLFYWLLMITSCSYNLLARKLTFISMHWRAGKVQGRVEWYRSAQLCKRWLRDVSLAVHSDFLDSLLVGCQNFFREIHKPVTFGGINTETRRSDVFMTPKCSSAQTPKHYQKKSKTNLGFNPDLLYHVVVKFSIPIGQNFPTRSEKDIRLVRV